ncbi:MAG: hypothetical protein UHO11_05845 [Treponema sp.]|nr:hypothetical protein [Treponema sp.]
MSKKFISFYFVLAVAVYIFSIALFIKNTVYEYKDGSKTCITLSNTIKNDFSTKGMAKAVKALDSNPDVAAFTVKKNGLSVAGRNENFNFEETSRFIHSDIWTLSDEENTTVSIALFKLKPAAIFNNAKTSFLIILACTLLTMLLLILDPVFSPAKKENYSTVDESVNLEDEEINTEEADITENSTEDSGSSEEEDISLPDSEPEVDRIEEPAHEPAENTETSLTQAEATAENNQNPENQEDFDIEIFPQDDSVKIESLEEESPLSEKINSILSDNKAEVSLFLLCYVGTEKDEEITEHVKSFIQDAYFPEDAIFTLNENTLALVKADTDIDQAEDFAADFHKALTEQVLSEKSGIQFDIGISSRATRTITAARLITEAKEALKHAISDNESHIIGFHVDIEKYNEFMKNRKQSN